MDQGKDEELVTRNPRSMMRIILAAVVLCLIAIIVRGLYRTRTISEVDPRVKQKVNEVLEDVRRAESEGSLLMATKELRMIGKQAIPPLIEVLKDDDPHVRMFSVNVLGRMSDGQALAPLRDCTDDESPMVRSASIMALARLEDKSSVPVIQSALKDESPRVRADAVLALSFLDAKEAIPALVESLSDEYHPVRLAAIGALRDMDAKAEIPSLIRLLDREEDTDVRSKAHSALRMMTDQPITRDRRKWEQWWEENKTAYLPD